MRKKLLAGNWKMNKLNAELSDYFEQFTKALRLNETQVKNQVDTLFAVPYLLLEKSASIAQKFGISIAAQNVHWEKSGAFTGEVSISMLKELRVQTTLIGHSERRQYFGETDETVTKKVKACLENGMTPIVCVGERREEREQGKTSQVVSRQMQAFLEVISSPGSLIVAYEPVWAIGTGLSATSDQAQEVHALIRDILSKKFGKGTADTIRILYGGSASPKNVDDLFTKPDIDGCLVGGASLKPDEFAAMVLAGR